MAKKSPPAPPPQPDPTVVAAAQTGSNVTTGISNSILGNANQFTPYGQTTFDISGYEPVTDPNSGLTYQIPRFNQRNELNKEQQTLLNQQNQMGMGLNEIALGQMGRISNLLEQPVQAPPGGLTNRIDTGIGPRYDVTPTDVGVISGFGNTQGNVQYGFGTPDRGVQYDITNPQQGVQYQFAPTQQGIDYGFQRQVGADDFSQDRMRVEEALYSRINPQIEQDRSQLENQLVNQGLTRGTPAFDQAMDQANRQANDARMQAIMAGGQEQSRLFGMDVTQGQFYNQALAAQNAAQQQDYTQLMGRAGFANQANQQEFAQNAQRVQLANLANQQQYEQMQNRASFNNAAQMQDYGQLYDRAQFHNAAQNQQYGQHLSDSQLWNAAQAQHFNEVGQQASFGNQAYAQQLQMDMALRNQMINETSALMSGGQVTLPNFQGYNPGQVAATPVGDYYMTNAQIAAQNYQAGLQYRSQQMAGMYSGIGSVLGAGMYALGRSDIRVKEDIERIGTMPNGLPIYSFRFIGEPETHIGLMAQDVERVHPEAVVDVLGVKHVDYSRAVH